MSLNGQLNVTSRKTAKRRVFVMFLLSGFNLEGNVGTSVTHVMTANVCGISVETRSGSAVRSSATSSVVIIETFLSEKASQIVACMIASKASIGVLTDTHMDDEQIKLLNEHLGKVYGWACDGTAAMEGGKAGVIIAWKTDEVVMETDLAGEPVVITPLAGKIVVMQATFIRDGTQMAIIGAYMPVRWEADSVV